MDYDVIVVGARVAGSILAARLSQHGHRVLLLEKATFPSDTLSTSFFRAPALRVFESLGVLDEIKAAAPPMEMLWNYIDGHVFSDPVEAPEPHLRYFLSERRITLDSILHRRVQQEAQVDIRLGAKVQGLLWEGERVAGVRSKAADGMHEARARAVIGADGLYSTVARLVVPTYETFMPVQRCTYYAYYQGLEPLETQPLAEHHFVGNTLTYVFPTDGNLTMVALSLPISQFSSFKQQPLAHLQAHLAALPWLAPRLRRAEVVSEVRGAGNIPSYQRVPYGLGWAVVGDAHQVLDPWSGMGIDHAATHANFLAEALNLWLKDYTSWKVALNGYHTRARQWSAKTYRRTTTFASDLRPMTRMALERRGFIEADIPQRACVAC